MKKLAYTPLALSVASVLFSPVVFADNQQAPETNLSVLTVVDRQGAKIKTDVVTTAIKDENTSTDLRGLLKNEPSIDFGNGNGAAQFITIRGMGQNSIDVKVDNAYSDSQILYHQGRFTLDPSLVKVVAVQKGAGSASAGIGATNGAIIAKTVDANDLLKGSDKDWGVKVNAGYSSNKEHGFGVTGFGRANNFDFLIATNRVDQENYKAGKGYVSINNDDTVPFSASDKVSYLAKAGYNLGDHRFVLSHFKDTNKGVRSIREEFDVRPANEIGGRLTLARQEPQYRELSLENTNLEWTGKNLGFVQQVTANAYVMKNTRESDDDAGCGYCGGSRTNANALIKADNPKTKTSVETKGVNLNLDSQLTDNTLVKYGINHRHQEVIPNRRDTFVQNNAEKTDTGVYAEAIHDIGQFTLTGGLRYDHFDYTAVTGKSVSSSRVSPSVGVIFQATPDLSFNATHNHSTRSPRLVDALLSGGRNVSIADGTKAERAKNSEIGFNFNNGNFSADGSVFYQRIDGLLTSGQLARHDAPTETYAGIYNVGYATNKGWELNTGYRFQNLTARLGVAESKPKFYSTEKDASGNLPAFTNKEYGARIGRTWTAGLAYRFDQPNVEVGINHRYVEDATGNTIWMNSTDENLSAIRDGYNVTDVYSNWKPLNNDKLNVNFAINNLSNKDYRTHSGAGLPGVGREFRVGVNYQF